MVKFENSVRIERPVAYVFTFVANLENLPKWNYFVESVEKTSAGPLVVGTTYHQVRQTDSQNLKITALQRNELLVMETIPPSEPQLERRLEFRPDNGATELIDRWKLDTGHPGFLQKLAARKIQAAVRENLSKLEELLETGRVTLQDGREMTL